MLQKMPLSTVNDAEIAKFSAMAEEWWDPRGKFKPLHQMNPVRIGYIKSHMNGFEEKSVLDIGCGGGLLAEPMARLGAAVTAIDAGAKNIAIATLHAQKEGLEIDYRHTTAEALATTGAQYDCVTALEIIEHVYHVPAFLAACAQLVKPGGLLFVSTLNRTAKSYAMAILGAEYLLRWLPVGTHEWKKFLKPAELISEAEKHHLTLHSADGFSFAPLSQKWSISKDLSVNYMVCLRKS